MEIRRYYPRGYVGKTYSDEYIAALKEKGVNTDAIDTAKEKLILTPEEQRKLYNQCCDMILNDTRWVLDNLESLYEFQVDFEDYHSKEYLEGMKMKKRANHENEKRNRD